MSEASEQHIKILVRRLGFAGERAERCDRLHHLSDPSGPNTSALARIAGALQPAAADPYPFIGLTFTGPAHEADHLRDYQKEALLAERQHQTQLKRHRPRSFPTTLTEALLDGRYQRYLNGK